MHKNNLNILYRRPGYYKMFSLKEHETFIAKLKCV